MIHNLPQYTVNRPAYVQYAVKPGNTDKGTVIVTVLNQNGVTVGNPKTYTGAIGSNIGDITPNIPANCKLKYITDNNNIVTKLPTKFSNVVQNITYHVIEQSQIRYTIYINGRAISSNEIYGAIGTKPNYSLPSANASIKLAKVLFNGEEVKDPSVDYRPDFGRNNETVQYYYVTKTKPEVKPAAKNTTVKPADKNTKAKPADKNTTVKPADKNTEAKPAAKNTTVKPVDKNTEAKPAAKNTTVKPVDKNTEAKPAAKNTTAKPADKNTEAKPADKSTTVKPADKNTEAKPAGKNTTAKPADKNTEAKPVAKNTTVKPTDKNTETKPADKSTTVKPADKNTEAKPADKSTTVKPADKNTEAKPADKNTSVKSAAVNKDNKVNSIEKNDSNKTVKAVAHKESSVKELPHTGLGKSQDNAAKDAGILATILSAVLALGVFRKRK